MQTRTIEILIDKDGKVNVESFGFKGQGCEETINLLTQGLGQIAEQNNKLEYGETEPVRINSFTSG